MTTQSHCAHIHRRSPAHQRGAALVVGLVLLLVMTLLGISGLTANTLDLAMSGNTQFSQDAFQAAESAIEAELQMGPLPDTNVARVGGPFSFANNVTATATTTFGATQMPPPGYSLTEFQADHYTITSTGNSSKNANSLHLQGYYVVIPTPTNE